MPLGTWNLKVSAPGRPELTTPCELDANSVYSVLLVDRNGSLTGRAAHRQRRQRGGAGRRRRTPATAVWLSRFVPTRLLLLAGAMIAAVTAATGLAGWRRWTGRTPARDR